MKNHASEIVALDFFTVPTAAFRVLFVLIVLAHDRRRILHFNVTGHPTARWTGQQIVEAFAWDSAPKYLVRDRDAIYGSWFQQRVTHLGIDQILAAPQSPWQIAHAERVLGSIRRVCLDHVIVLSADHCRHVLARYFQCYHRWRTPLSLAMDTPDTRPVQRSDQGTIVAVPEVGGLHHHYERGAA
jgi:putative transposase